MKTLRDEIAIAALQGLIIKLPLYDREGEIGKSGSREQLHQIRCDLAESAYDYADAMLLHRKATENEHET